MRFRMPFFCPDSIYLPVYTLHMQDLLKEDEFIKPKYNPWKRFGIFYVITFVGSIAYYFVQELITGEELQDNQLMITIFGLPSCMSFIMIFNKNENIRLPLKTIALALLILMLVFFLAFVVTGFLHDFSNFIQEIQYVFMFGGVYFLLFILISAIILPIVWAKKKRKLALKRNF